MTQSKLPPADVSNFPGPVRRAMLPPRDEVQEGETRPLEARLPVPQIYEPQIQDDAPEGREPSFSRLLDGEVSIHPRSVWIEDTYVIDEKRVDSFARGIEASNLAVLLPGWAWESDPWPSLKF